MIILFNRSKYLLSEEVSQLFFKRSITKIITIEVNFANCRTIIKNKYILFIFNLSNFFRAECSQMKNTISAISTNPLKQNFILYTSSIESYAIIRESNITKNKNCGIIIKI